MEEELVLLGGEDQEKVFQAMFALKKRGKDAVAPLVALLEDQEQSPTLRARIIDTLALIPRVDVQPQIIAALDDPDVEVRIHAIGALSEIGDGKSLPALERISQNDGGLLVIGGTQYIAVQDEINEAIRLIRERGYE